MSAKPVQGGTKSHAAAKGGAPKVNEDPKKADSTPKDEYIDGEKNPYACNINLVTAWVGRKDGVGIVRVKGCPALRLFCKGPDQVHKECIYSVSVDGKGETGGKWQSTDEAPERTIPSSAPGKKSRFEVKVLGVK